MAVAVALAGTKGQAQQQAMLAQAAWLAALLARRGEARFQSCASCRSFDSLIAPNGYSRLHEFKDFTFKKA